MRGVALTRASSEALCTHRCWPSKAPGAECELAAADAEAARGSLQYKARSEKISPRLEYTGGELADIRIGVVNFFLSSALNTEHQLVAARWAFAGEEAIKGMVAVQARDVAQSLRAGASLQARTKPYWAETPIKPLY